MKSTTARRDYHQGEAVRIQGELAGLGDAFPEDSVVRTILRERIAEEKARAAGVERCSCHGA